MRGLEPRGRERRGVHSTKKSPSRLDLHFKEGTFLAIINRLPKRGGTQRIEYEPKLYILFLFCVYVIG